jgi:PD-(D/E)XK nuclease superfamily
MPRPKDGYRNAAGDQVPGVHDITNRYKNMHGLMNWIHQEGLKGNVNPYASAADIGTVVHKMAELDLRGAPEREIERVPHEMLSTPTDIDKAFQAFRAFQEWRKQHDVRAIAFEEALVSEQWGFGGTFDCIAWVDGVRCLIDFKTCKTAGQVYLEQRLVMAAHGHLWHQHHPALPLTGYHLVNLPKDGSRHGVHSFASLDAEWEMFTLQLDCWRIEKGLTRKRATKAKTVVPAPKAALADLAARLEAMAAEATAPVQAADPFRPANAPPLKPPPAVPAKPKRARKTKADATPVMVDEPDAEGILPSPVPVQIVMETIAPPPHEQLSMAALLRAYGHIREAA